MVHCVCGNHQYMHMCLCLCCGNRLSMVWVAVAQAILCGLEEMCGLRVHMRAHHVFEVLCAMDIHNRWTACLCGNVRWKR